MHNCYFERFKTLNLITTTVSMHLFSDGSLCVDFIFLARANSQIHCCLFCGWLVAALVPRVCTEHDSLPKMGLFIFLGWPAAAEVRAFN